MNLDNSPIVILAALLGWIVGAVVNLLADQLPMLGQSVNDDAITRKNGVKTSPPPNRLSGPRCSNCGQSREALAWSGIIATLTGRRQCSRCGKRLPVRHLLVESFLVVAFGYLALVYGLTANGVVLTIYLTIFMLIAIIDIEHRYILNIVMIPAFAFALLEVVFSGRVGITEWRSALAGYALAQIAMMGIYLMGGAYLWLVNRRRKDKVTEVAFGFGDVTVATFCGLILGTPAAFYMLVLMVFVGGAISVLYTLLNILFRRGYQAHTPIAYGPAILISAMAMLLWSDRVIGLLYGGR